MEKAIERQRVLLHHLRPASSTSSLEHLESSLSEVLLGLLSGKTVIYVTHQVEFLNAADLILVMKNGRTVQVGKYDEILVPGSHFIQLVGAQNAALPSTLDNSTEAPISADNMKIILRNGTVNGKVDEDGGAAGSAPAAQLVKEEERESGRVGFPVYWKYLTTAYAGALVIFMILAPIILQILQIGSNYWLAWATPSLKDVKPVVNGSTLIIVYASLGFGMCLCTLVESSLVVATGYKTATILFQEMIETIFHAPMSFFDATPAGRILNRCSTDQSAVETRIPSFLDGFFYEIGQLVGVIAVMSIVSWEVLVIFIPLIFACIWYQWMAKTRKY